MFNYLLMVAMHRATKGGSVAKPAHKGPSTQANKGKQGKAPKILFDEPKRSSPIKPLKITISNDATQRPILVRLLIISKLHDSSFALMLMVL